MRSFALVSAIMGVAMAAPSLQLDTRAKNAFSIARPGGIDDIIITKDNTLNGTYRGPEARVAAASAAASAVDGNLPLEFVNNYSGGNVNAYITGLDSDNRVVFIGANGQLIYPDSGGSAQPIPITDPIAIPMGGLGSTFKLTMPITMSSGRIYFSEGELPFFVVRGGAGDGIVQPSVTNLQDPSTAINWGFVEFTYTTEKAVYANISYVDFVGLILSMSLSVTDGSGTQITKGLQANAVQNICNGLVDQGNSDGYPWARMCVAGSNGQPIRALSPGDYSSINADDFRNYWQSYVDQVWAKYTNEPLIVDSQQGFNASCRVTGDVMNCDGDNRGYNKPTAQDIWGCDSGPFGKQSDDNAVHLANIPRLCAAFVRSTLLLPGGNIQPSLPSSSYYTVNPTNHFSRIVHANEVDGRGYAFPYDDVNPDGENASGLVSSGNPGVMTVYFGGYP